MVFFRDSSHLVLTFLIFFLENSSILPEPSTSTHRGPFSLLPVLHGFRNKPANNTITTQVTRQKNKLIIEEKIKNQRKNEKK
jgi:hypothetical protein